MSGSGDDVELELNRTKDNLKLHVSADFDTKKSLSVVRNATDQQATKLVMRRNGTGIFNESRHITSPPSSGSGLGKIPT